MDQIYEKICFKSIDSGRARPTILLLDFTCLNRDSNSMDDFTFYAKQINELWKDRIFDQIKGFEKWKPVKIRGILPLEEPYSSFR